VTEENIFQNVIIISTIMSNQTKIQM